MTSFLLYRTALHTKVFRMFTSVLPYTVLLQLITKIIGVVNVSKSAKLYQILSKTFFCIRYLDTAITW